MQKINAQMESNVINLLAHKKLDPVFKELTSYEYAVIKGEALSMMAYGKVGKRTSTDIDILISKNNLVAIENILTKYGYYSQWSNASKFTQRQNRILCISSSHQIAAHRDKLQMISIDVNFDIFWGEYEGRRIDINCFLSDVIDANIYSSKVRILPPIKALIQLILHHYKDMNSIFLLATRKSIRHEMFKDIYYLLKNNLEAISLDKLYDISAEYEIIPYVYYVLYHTGQLYNDEILQQYIAAFKTPEGETLLNCYGLNESERREWRVDFKTRLESENLYDLIKDDLTERDKEKIAINRRVFLGGAE